MSCGMCLGEPSRLECMVGSQPPRRRPTPLLELCGFSHQSWGPRLGGGKALTLAAHRLGGLL